jgi:hypothetical protein
VDRNREPPGPELVAASAVAGGVFFLFSNRMGCGLSLLVSAAITLLLLIAFGWVRL